MDTLGALDIFVLVAERLSFAAAGRKLGLSPSAVGKKIARLESRLGARVFHRTTRQVSLTAEGEMLLERARRIREDVDGLASLLAKAAAEPQGRLRVSLPTIGYRFLTPHLNVFRRAYPKVRLDLDFSDGLVDLVAEGVDVAIRGGPLANSSLMSRKLGSFRYLICASPTYLAERGEPITIASLTEHRLVRYRQPGSDALQEWALVMPMQSNAAFAAPDIICTNMEAVLAATVAGLGIACMPDFLAVDALRRGEIKPILANAGSSGEFWLIWPGGRRTPPRVRAFIDFATETILTAH